VIIELFADVTPRTAENFRALCTGEYGLGRHTRKKLCYEGCNFFRSVKNFMIQTGDFQFNNGDGGESIYGGTFNDEDFVRRHTQAGVVSMANKGRNSNGSQFFITLKRSVQLDNKHVAFGQVVEGMDVVRAVAAVPTDKDERPRVACTIVGCGEVGSKSTSGLEGQTELSRQIQGLTEEVEPKANAAQQGKQILAGKQGGAALGGEISGTAVRKQKVVEEEIESEGAGIPMPKTEREKRLYQLRLKMNQGRAANSKEVIEEQKRESDPGYSKKVAAKRVAEEEKKEEDDKKDTKSRKTGMPEGKDYLNDTIETAESREAKKKKGNPDAFGWDVFNQDSLLRAHEKRLKHIQFHPEAYEKQKKQIEEEGEEGLKFAGFGFKPTEEAKSRLGEAMDKIMEKKKEFSRRRAYNDEEDRTYVNDRNRFFNKKLDRFFGDYTEETRQNLERGTAL